MDIKQGGQIQDSILGSIGNPTVIRSFGKDIILYDDLMSYVFIKA